MLLMRHYEFESRLYLLEQELEDIKNSIPEDSSDDVDALIEMFNGLSEKVDSLRKDVRLPILIDKRQRGKIIVANGEK